MMRTLKNLFRPKTPAEKTLDPHVAVAALLVEAALIDGVYVNIESDKIAEILLESFGFDAARADALLAEAESLAEESVGAHQFTKHVKKLEAPERVKVIETLYRVMLADHELNADEEAYARRIAGLLYVDDVSRALCRQRAKAATGR